MGKSRFELGFDIFLVVGIAIYLYVALSYPPKASTVPATIGYAALGVALIHLLGNFIPFLGKYTHGAVKSKELFAAKSEEISKSTLTSESEADAEYKPKDPKEVNRRQMTIIITTLLFFAGLYVLGYFIAVPLFALLNFLILDRRGWKMAVSSAIILAVVTYLFQGILGVYFPEGWIFQVLK